ncbi:MAG: nitroreductase family protein, partial [Oceanospirillaceae bacterium]|nr:nitroreductase family protein [Oceanospirillaceae bacterium]
MMDLSEAIKSRRTCRAFTSKPVSEGLINEVLQLASRAPS